jgi:hypothetical protein
MRNLRKKKKSFIFFFRKCYFCVRVVVERLFGVARVLFFCYYYFGDDGSEKKGLSDSGSLTANVPPCSRVWTIPPAKTFSLFVLCVWWLLYHILSVQFKFSSFVSLFCYHFPFFESLRHSVRGEKSIVWLSHSMWQRNRKKEFPPLFTNVLNPNKQYKKD